MPEAWLRILIAAALCMAALIGLVVREGAAREGGREIVLAMGAIDPRSLLSGHYVIVDFNEALAPGAECPPAPLNAAEQEWVAFAPHGAHHSIAGAAATRAEASGFGPIAARGHFICEAPDPGGEGIEPRPGWVRAFIGIDRFHIAQGEAERIERVLREQRPGEEADVFAIVSVGGDGRARLKGLIVEGERLELNWF